MRRWRPRLERRASDGPPVTVGDMTITPRSTALLVRIGGAAFVWNRPIGVDVERGGARRRLRIVDRGRIARLGLGGVLALLILLGVAGASPRKERER